MKLEPNMYIRTKEGKIDKVLEINTEDFDEPVVRLASFPLGMYQGKFEYEKASHNIIDLIEVGDYVNGCKVIDFMYSKEKKRSVIVDSEIWGFDSEEIKSIVTKEIFSQMKYKVGE